MPESDPVTSAVGMPPAYPRAADRPAARARTLLRFLGLARREDARDLLEQFARQVAQPPDRGRQPVSGLSMQVDGPHRGLIRLGSAGEEADQHTREHVPGSRGAESGIAGAIGPAAAVRG